MATTYKGKYPKRVREVYGTRLTWLHLHKIYGIGTNDGTLYRFIFTGPGATRADLLQNVAGKAMLLDEPPALPLEAEPIAGVAQLVLDEVQIDVKAHDFMPFYGWSRAPS